MTPDTIDVLALPSLPLAERKTLPFCAAVYFVLGTDDAILYIGQTHTLRQRWSTHHRFALSLPDVRIAWVAVDDLSALRSLETACILHFAPPLNAPIGGKLQAVPYPEDAPPPRTLGERVKSRRLALGLSQETLAARMQVRQNVISRMEVNRITNPGIDMARRLALALEVTTDWLVGMPGGDRAEEHAGAAV